MRDSTGRMDGERALSEVVGFVLIIGVLVVVASLYLAYGVPAQGRENEILHMNTVKDQFVSYKLSLDSLFNNNKVDTTVSNSFTLGTSGGYTQGTFSFIPVLSPVSSSGVIAINQRTTEPETLTVRSDSLVANSTVFYKQDLPATLLFTPSHVYINISGIQQSDLNRNGIFGATAKTPAWSATVNLTPQVSFYQKYDYVSTNPCPLSSNGSVLDLGGNTCLVPINIYNYEGSDLMVSISKGSILTMQNYPVYESVVPGRVYTIDLMDEAYGLQSVTNPSDTITLTTEKSLGAVTATGNASYDFAEMNPYTVSPIPLGSVE